ncbi:MAG: succinate dehydrogenase, partial [Acidobacteriota bacterium]|nr:succinate dehydrogenase [Acidobacteriota bacterium]
DPPSCAVGEPRGHGYRGERKFPLVLQNVHRYFLYLALIFIVFLALDVWNALWFTDAATGRASFGIGVGTIILALTVFFLAGYTFSCHSLRHLVGGKCDELSDKPVRGAAYKACSALNRRHMLWAWLSLFFVGFSDIYVRLCSMGVWTDWRIL